MACVLHVAGTGSVIFVINNPFMDNEHVISLELLARTWALLSRFQFISSDIHPNNHFSQRSFLNILKFFDFYELFWKLFYKLFLKIKNR